MRHLFWLSILVAALLLSACGGDDNDDALAPSPPGGGDDGETVEPPAWAEPQAPLRGTRSLDGVWEFAPDGYPFREVKVPCFWEAYPKWEEYDSCPGYLDGTPDEGLDIEKGDNWWTRAIHKGTYVREIEIDDPAAVTRIWFESIHHQASVFFNDEPIGVHKGPYWKADFDVSKAVVAGTNTLRVELTDGAALLGEDGVTRFPVGWYSHWDTTGLYRSVTMESLPPVFVDDAFVVPSVRRGDLTVQYTIRSSRFEDFAGWLVARAVGTDGEVAFESKAVPVYVAAGGTAKTTVMEPFENAIHWTPPNPHLYTLRTLLLDERGEPADLREDRFGFREVWIEDGHFVLNGMRMNLIGDSVDGQATRPRYWALKYLSCDAARDTLTRIREMNFNMVRYHQAPPNDCLNDIADEIGLLVMSESPVYARTEIHPLFYFNEEYLANSQAWWKVWVQRHRNHPSIVAWSLENEMFMFGFAMSPNQIWELQFPVKEADSVLRPDGTRSTPRPVNWDGDSPYLRLFGYEPETVNWHYPWFGYLTIDPREEWFDDAVARFAQFVVPGVPYGVGETMVVRRNGQWTEEFTPDMAKAQQGQAVRAMRILGYSDIRPYKLNWTWHEFDPEGWEHPAARWYHDLYTQEQKDRLVKEIREAYHPIAVFDHGYAQLPPNTDGTFGPVALPPASPVKRVLVVCNDSFLPRRQQTVTWKLIDETSKIVLDGGEWTMAVPHGFNEWRTISFETPDAAGPLPLTLRVTSEMEDLPQGVYDVEYRFVVEAE